MEHKLVVITSEYLHPFVEKAYEEIDLECEVEVVTYQNFENIASVYSRYEDEATGFVVSGNIAKDAIVKSIPDHKKPIEYFQTDSAGFYRLLLEHMIEKKNVDTKRVILDFLLTNHEDGSMEYFLNSLYVPMVQSELDEWVERKPMADLHTLERNVADKIIKLWKEDKLDVAICLYSSIIPELEAHGIPCRYPFPEKEQLKNMAVNVLAMSEIKMLRENFPAVIAVTCGGIEKTDVRRALKDALKDIKSNLVLDFILKEEKDSYHLYTSLQNVDFLTDKKKICHLSNTLKEDYDISALVGYGVGRNITSAKVNAEDALKEAVFSKESFIMDENKRLIGPLNADQCLAVDGTVSREICSVAEKCKLSTLTIQKLSSIIKMNGHNRITTQELAERLGVTVRNANRILKNLENGGAAVISYTQSTTSKGRPVNVYELKFE